MHDRETPPTSSPDATTVQPNIALPHRNIYYFDQKKVGAKVLKPLGNLGAYPATDKMIIERYESIRQQIIERFPSNVEGLNLERVHAFASEQDFRDVPTIIINKDQREEYVDFAASIRAPSFRREAHGEYNPLLDLIVVYRNKELEAENGAEITESWLVHELAHASSAYADISGIRDEKLVLGVRTPRVGLALKTAAEEPGEQNVYGLLLEEGWAEYMRGDYISNKLGLPHGILHADVATAALTDKNITVPFPTKYMYMENGSPTASQTSLAGATMDLLIEKDPSLLEALREARKTPDGLREVAKKINDIKPGLYKYMRDNFSDEKTFFDGLHYIDSM